MALRTALALTLIASPAWAIKDCDTSEAMYSALAEEWGEQRATLGLVNGQAFETWANPETGTWTILRTTADGTSCHLASGDAWMTFDFLVGEPS